MAQASVRTTAEKPVERARPSSDKGAWRKRLKKSLPWYLFIAPNVISFLVFTLFVWILLIYLSLSQWNMIGSIKWVGFSNYGKVIQDPIFLKAVGNTVRYAAMFVIPATGIALFVAMLANQRLRGIYVFRAIYYLPVVTSIAVISMIWGFVLLSRDDGPLNYLIGLLGIPPQKWLVDVNLALPSVVGMQVWSTLGYYMVLWLSGLQSVPEELYDAAKIDGAGMWGLFRHVTWPMLRPTTIFIVMVSTIGAFQMFGGVYILTGGGPAHATITIVYYVWQRAFARYNMGYASAISLLLFLIILVVTLIQRRLMNWSEDLY
jgi:ABC-type sugar transport system permease subunit